MAAANLQTNLENVLESSHFDFHQLEARTKLVVLHYLAQKIHRASKAATPSALFSQKVHNVLKQMQQLSHEERYDALEEILRGSPTRLTEAYDELDTNMRMAFWYRLVNSRRDGVLSARPYAGALSSEQEMLLSELESRDSNELVTLLREAVKADAIA